MRFVQNKTFLALVLSASLAACGGTTSPGSDNNDGGTSGGGAGGSTGGGTTTINDTLALGSFDVNGDFQKNVIAATITDIAAGQSTTLSVAVIDAEGNTSASEAAIAFTSPCANDALSEFDPQNGTTVGGRISTTYTATGCDGGDAITATGVIDNTTLRAVTTLNTQAAPPGSIGFDSASSSVIGIRGTGGTLAEQATLTFRITNTAGGPAPNQTVNFDLNTDVGGITLSNAKATTNADGLVSTTVNAGTVATTVRVTAIAVNNAGATLRSQSNGLSITTGIPDNDSFTIGAEALNIEGYDINNVTTQVTALLADRFNNPVPDGTSVLFSAEGGSIDGSCVTESGQCSVTFRSQNPRPSDGRVTILATATGEESFVDANGDGVYQQNESFFDLPEAYRDDNENRRRDGDEFFLDFNSDQNYSPASGNFTGVLCDSGCDQANSMNPRASLVLVLSGSSLNITAAPRNVDLTNGALDVTVTVLDGRNQIAAAGTTIEAQTTQGSIADPTSYTQESDSVNPNGAPGEGTYIFRVEPGDDAGDGSLLITVTTPEGDGTISRLRVPVTQN